MYNKSVNSGTMAYNLLSKYCRIKLKNGVKQGGYNNQITIQRQNSRVQYHPHYVGVYPYSLHIQIILVPQRNSRYVKNMRFVG